MSAAIIVRKDKYVLIYKDQTGVFNQISSKGYKYIIVLYYYDSNAIIAEPLKSRMQIEILQVYKKLHGYLTKLGLCPKLKWLDNEASRISATKWTSKISIGKLYHPTKTGAIPTIGKYGTSKKTCRV